MTMEDVLEAYGFHISRNLAKTRRLDESYDERQLEKTLLRCARCGKEYFMTGQTCGWCREKDKWPRS